MNNPNPSGQVPQRPPMMPPPHGMPPGGQMPVPNAGAPFMIHPMMRAPMMPPHGMGPPGMMRGMPPVNPMMQGGAPGMFRPAFGPNGMPLASPLS